MKKFPPGIVGTGLAAAALTLSVSTGAAAAVPPADDSISRDRAEDQPQTAGSAGARAVVAAFPALDELPITEIPPVTATIPDTVEDAPYGRTDDDAPESRAEQIADPEVAETIAENSDISERAAVAYLAAAETMAVADPGCNITWNQVAGIGYVETWHGTYGDAEVTGDGTVQPEILGIPLDGTNNTISIRDTDDGVLDGDRKYDRAVGPTQFIPTTWELLGTDGSGDGIADPHNIDDAALSTARYLCDSGGDLSKKSNWRDAVFTYNHLEEYVRNVTKAAKGYAKAD